MDEPPNKRGRLDTTFPETPPPEDPKIVNVTESPMFNDDPIYLLQRSVALALQHVGFDGASKEALEALCAEAETC